jgi:hypothetical protein
MSKLECQEYKGCVWFGFGFCPLKAKPRAGSRNQLFLKSRLSRGAKLKTHLYLLLAASDGTVKIYMKELQAIFSWFYQTVFRIFNSSAHNNFFHSTQRFFSQPQPNQTDLSFASTRKH